MKHHLFATSLLVAAFMSACSRAPETLIAGTAPPLYVTETVAAVRELPATFEAGGIVRARLTAAIASRVMASVIAVPVRAGDRIARGALLVSLDGREVMANRDRAVAAVAGAEQSVLAARSDVAAAQANVVLAQATHERIATLAARKSATPHELDEAVAALNAATAQLQASEARSAAASAALDASRSTEMAADASASYTRLTAPFDGVITEQSVDRGAMAMPGVPLLTIEDPSTFQVEVRLDESRATQVHVGDAVEVILDAPARVRDASDTSGHVKEIARIDPASHAFLVKIDLPTAPDLRSGAFARARFQGTSRRALAVSKTALVRRGQLSFVFRIDPPNRIARLRAVSPGAAVRQQVEILDGLADGDHLVDSPPPSLADGQRVEPMNDLARGEQR
jgi:RND family efflux transporter MFP subunit